MKPRNSVIVACILIAGTALGQEAPRPVAVSADTLQEGNRAGFTFDKLLSTYHWSAFAGYHALLGGVSTDFEGRYLSTIIRADRLLVRDDQLLRLNLLRRFSDQLAGVITCTSAGLSDNQNIGIGTASSHAAYGGLRVSPFQALSIEPRIGVRIDNQIEQRDVGLSYGLSGELDDLAFGNYTASARLLHQIDNVSPRLLQTHADTLIFDGTFGTDTENRLVATYASTQREFYVAADSVVRASTGSSQNFERRKENGIAVSDVLTYPIAPQLVMRAEGGFFGRHIARAIRYKNPLDLRSTPPNSSVEEFRINGGLSLSYQSASVAGTARILYQERTERHTVEQESTMPDSVFLPFRSQQERKNNESRRSGISADLRILPSNTDTVTISVSMGLLRYDTPNSSNDDDRDELTYLLGAGMAHRFSPFLVARLQADVTLIHLVYIVGTRSGDNTWNRIFRLGSDLDYSPTSRFFSRNRFEVLANYTAYDFEYLSSSIRSFVYRQFAFVDSTIFMFTGHLGIDWYSYLRLYERGELRWSEFRERPLQYFEDLTLIGKARYQASDDLLFSIGVRYFSQSRFAYTGSDRFLESLLRSVGPIASIDWSADPRTRVSFSGWYEHQTITGQPPRNFANMALVLSFGI